MSIKAMQTERLSIRPFRDTDWPAVYAYMSLPAAILYMAKSVLSEEETRIMQQIHQSLNKMEQRVEALETIIINRK